MAILPSKQYSKHYVFPILGDFFDIFCALLRHSTWFLGFYFPLPRQKTGSCRWLVWPVWSSYQNAYDVHISWTSPSPQTSPVLHLNDPIPRWRACTCTRYSPGFLILKAMKLKKNTKSWRYCSLFAGQNPLLMPHTALLSLLTTPSSVRRSPSSAQTSLLSILVLWNCPHLRWRVVPTWKITPWNLTG